MRSRKAQSAVNREREKYVFVMIEVNKVCCPNYREESLVVPLRVEVVVKVVEICPPSVIMRKYREAKQEGHRLPQLL
jgi:hypothetical protein